MSFLAQDDSHFQHAMEVKRIFKIQRPVFGCRTVFFCRFYGPLGTLTNLEDGRRYIPSLKFYEKEPTATGTSLVLVRLWFWRR